jgi:hypothetical protein
MEFLSILLVLVIVNWYVYPWLMSNTHTDVMDLYIERRHNTFLKRFYKRTYKKGI